MRDIENLKDVEKFRIKDNRLFSSATHEEIAAGATTDIYFIRTRDILAHVDKLNQQVTAEIFARRAGIFDGIEDVFNLLRDRKVAVESLEEGEEFADREVVMRISGPYGAFGHLETVILGMLSSPSGWATAARECVQAAGGKSVLCFGARHVHPAVAPVMERAARIGGVNGVSCILAARLLNEDPLGTIPHAAIIIIGDTVETALAYDEISDPDTPRLILVDTFLDEPQESIRVAQALGEKLQGVRLDTPSERGGVTPELVRETKARLQQAGFNHVKVFVSGGLTPERIRLLLEAGADGFGVGSYISSAPAIDMTMDIKVVAGKPVAKRGRIPGIAPNPRLKKLL